jgi:hypothetical protein
MPEPTETVAGSNAANVTAKVAPTTYIVLRCVYDSDAGHDQWIVAGSVDAPNAEAAIKTVAGRLDTPTGGFVAVPARSWKPVTVQAVQTTTLKLEDAK